MTDRPVPTASRKRVDEDIPLTYDFTNDLPTGVTVASAATCVATLYSQSKVADASPSAIVSGVPTVSSPNVTQKIVDGTDGASYFITFPATGSDGNVYIGECILLIEDES